MNDPRYECQPLDDHDLHKLMLISNVFKNTTEGIAILKADGTIEYVNPAFTHITGYSEHDAVNKNMWLHIFHKVSAHFSDSVDESIKVYGKWQGQLCSQRKNGEEYVQQLNISPVTNCEDDSITHYIVIFSDITEHSKLRTQLEENEENYFKLLEASSDVVCLIHNNKLIYINQSGVTLLGMHNASYLVGQSVHKVVHADSLDSIKNLMKSDIGLKVEGKLLKSDGDMLHAEVSTLKVNYKGLQCIQLTARDITQTKKSEEHLNYLIKYDSITGIYNKSSLDAHMENCLLNSKDTGKPFGILFLDLDRFKRINDSLGYEMGDALLKLVAERFSTFLDDDHSVYRVGGDEFVILLSGIKNVQDTVKTSQRIFKSLALPFIVNGNEVFITASIGISVYPFDGADRESLIKHAHTAMYHAKEQGRNMYQLYTHTMNATAFERLVLETGMRKALDLDQFVLYYQPKVDIKTRRVVGIEALIRWNHPDLGLVSPVEFIPLAEETGLIIPIGNWVMKTACEQIKIWQNQGYDNLHISVNISPQQFQKDLIANMKEILLSSNIDSKSLEIEITESTLMDDPELGKEILQKILNLGVSIAVDDFGVGYSSLNYLKDFPITCLKIDKSFISNITTNDNNATITKAVIDLAHNLNMKVVAEGVQTKEQLDLLKSYNCDQIQGYYFSRPVPAGQFTKLLKKYNKK